MNNSDETLEQSTAENKILQAIAELGKQLNERMDGLQNDLDSFKQETNKRFDAGDIQFEAIRTGIVANGVAFDRLQATVFSMRANLTELTEEIRRNQKALI